MYSSGCNSKYYDVYNDKIINTEWPPGGGFITVNDVSQAIYGLKLNKAAGPDGIAADALVFGGHRLAVYLTYLFNLCIYYNYLPCNLIRTVIIPLVKNKSGQLSDANNYRAIALSNTCSKVLESVILNYLQDMAVVNNDDYQFGFKSSHSTDMCAYVLKNTVRYYTKFNSHVFACFIDFTKAFDSVDYWLLFSKLYDAVPNSKGRLFTRILSYWYSNQEAYVLWNSTVSTASSCFKIANGVKQGGILSPYLFRFYIHDVCLHITELKIGCSVANTMFNLLCYADDMVLLAPSWNALQILITRLQKGAMELNLTYNTTKTVCMVFNPSLKSGWVRSHFPSFTSSGNELKFVSQFKYLGHIICNDLRDDTDIQREIKVLFTRCNILKNRFNKCSLCVKLQLFRTYCNCFYGVALWTNFTVRVLRRCLYHHTLNVLSIFFLVIISITVFRTFYWNFTCHLLILCYIMLKLALLVN